jgi:hypothetical protein
LVPENTFLLMVMLGVPQNEISRPAPRALFPQFNLSLD